MPTIIENINSLINTKNELNAILNENGVDGGEIFSEYPSYFRSVIAQGGGGSDKVSYSYLEEKLSYYPTYSYVDENYVSYSYLGDLEDITYYILGSGDPYSPENVYATKFELASYVKSSDLQSMSYVSKSELSAQSYLTAVPNTYPTYTDISNMGYVTGTDLDNASYVSITDLSSMGYATTSDLNGYLPLGGGIITGDLTVSKNIIGSSDVYFARQKENRPSYLWLGSSRPWKIWENGTELTVTSNVGNKNLRFSGYNSTVGMFRVFSINENSTTADSSIIAHSQITHENVTYHKGITYDYNTIYSYNITPCEDNTYTLGDASHLYSNTYTNKLWFNSGNVIYNDNTYQIVLKLNNSDKYVFRTEYIRPISNNGATLGTSGFKFNATYTSNIYTNTVYISSATYLPVNTYWYDGNSYHWLGDLFN